MAKAEAAAKALRADTLGQIWEQLSFLEERDPDQSEALVYLQALRSNGLATIRSEPWSELKRKAPAYLALYSEEWATTYDSTMQVYLLTVFAEEQSTHRSFTDALELLREARAIADSVKTTSEKAPDRNNKYYTAYCDQRIAIIQGCVFRDLGLIDRAEVELAKLENGDREPRPDLVIEKWHVALLRIRVDMARKRWSQLEDDIDATLLDIQDDAARLEITPGRHGTLLYRSAHAGYEKDPTDPNCIERARRGFQEALNHEGSTPRVRFMSQVRLARIALRQGELSDCQHHLGEAAREAAEASRQGKPRAAYELADHAVCSVRLARAQGDGLPEAEDTLLDNWTSMLMSWREAPPRPGGIGYLFFDNTQRVLGEVVRVMLRREGPGGALEVLYEAHAAGTLSKKLDQSGQSPRLDPPQAQEAQLVYLVTYEGIHAFFRLEGDLQYEWTPIEERVRQQMLDSFIRLVSTSPRSRTASPERAEGIKSLGAKIFDIVVPADWRSAIAAQKRLTICGVDQLDHLPFEALGSPLGKPLGQTHELCYLPSLPLQHQLQYRGSPEHSFVLASGGAGVGLRTGWAEDLRSSYTSSRVLSGEKANATHIDQIPGRVFQALGHGRLNYTQEIPARVELEGGDFGYEDVRQLTHLPDLALLTACGVWRGPERSGDAGAGHLASAFLRSGTRTVVLPYADIEVESTLRWSEFFHAALSAGSTPAASALAARQKLQESGTYADPFYHSLLHVVGQGHLPVFAQDSLVGSEGHKRGFRGLVALASAFALGSLALLALVVHRRKRKASPSLA